MDGQDAQDARSTSQQTGTALSILHTCNTAVQCSSLWSTFGQSVSLSLSIETETETTVLCPISNYKRLIEERGYFPN